MTYRSLLTAAVIAVSALSTSCATTTDDPNGYMSGGKASLARSNAKWAAIEAAGWCPLRTSYFPRPKPGCKPLPPGGVREIEYEMAKAGQPLYLASSTTTNAYQTKQLHSAIKGAGVARGQMEKPVPFIKYKPFPALGPYRGPSVRF